MFTRSRIALACFLALPAVALQAGDLIQHGKPPPHECHAPCRLLDWTGFVSTLAYSSLGTPPGYPCKPGAKCKPCMPGDPCDIGPPNTDPGTEVCSLYVQTFSGSSCDGPDFPTKCSWSAMQSEKGKLLGTVELDAGTACLSSQFPPYKYEPKTEYTFPAGVQLSEWYPEPIGNPPPLTKKYYLSIKHFFLNYATVKIAAAVPLEVKNDYIVGQLPEVAEPTDMEVQLLAENSNGSEFYQFVIHLVPAGNQASGAKPSGRK